jgi:LuxR family quorum sensing-dependent transcriptional regulator
VFIPAMDAVVAAMQTSLYDWCGLIAGMPSPDGVLDELHAFASKDLPLSVLGAVRFPLKPGVWPAVGKSAWVHKSVPKAWRAEYRDLRRGKHNPMMALAMTSMAAHTWTEVQRIHQPIGADRWLYELLLKHGMRDGLNVPVGGRWVVVYWSRKELSGILTMPTRIMLATAAAFAALRLDQLAELDPSIVGPRAELTPRELAVLRMIATGALSAEIAAGLKLGEETVRTHTRKALAKLGARNRAQAVAEALRQHLIP